VKWFLICLAAGLASACGFAPLNLWPLTIAGIAILLLAVERAPSLRAALLRGWAFGYGQFALGLNWIATAFTYQSNMPHWVGWIAVFALALYLAVYPAVAAGLAWRWRGADRLRLVLIFAAAWIVTEYLRGVLFTGFPWNPLGIALLPTPAVHLAAWIGTYALAGVLILIAGAIYAAVLRDWRTLARLGPAAAASFLGGLALSSMPLGGAEGALVRIVQPNVPQAQKHEEGYGPQLRRFQEAALRPAPEPVLHLWPEDGIPYFLDEDPLEARRLGAWIGPRDLILTGGAKIERDLTGRIAGARNSVWLLNREGDLLARYDKAHLVPYGEYLPARPLLTAIGLSRVVPGELDFWEGPGPRTLDLPGFGRAGIQICYEIVFSGQVVDRANRPDFIFNPSNDAWFGWWGPPQHFAQARMRAIEEGLPVLRATPTGVSGVIDARGRVQAAVATGEHGVIDARLPPAAAPTLFARLGNWAPFIVAGFLLLLAALSALQSHRKGASEPRS
jgi:apolipoprotein N-acyltransferase